MENIIINFTSDAAGLQPGIEGLDQIMESDKAVADQAKKTMEAYSKRDKTITDANKNSQKSIDGLAASIKNLDKSMIGGIGGKALDDLRSTLKLTDGQWKQFYTNLIKTAKAELVSAKQKEDIEQLNQLINGAEIALKKMAEKEELVNTTSKSMKAELRALKQELQQMEDQGKDNTAEFEQMAIKAGKLEDQIGDTNARIKALGSDTFVFDALISGVTGLTGAFAAVQGAAALFGDENEDLQRALLKVNAAMSILQGLQAVQNVLQKQSAASIAIDLVMRRNQTAATVAQTVATEAQAAATTQAAVAQTGLNTAMKMSPAGWLLIGITAITAAIFAFGKSSSEVKEDVDGLNESLERQNDIISNLGDLNSYENRINRLRLKLKGGGDADLFKYDIDTLKKSLSDAEYLNKKHSDDLFKYQSDVNFRNEAYKVQNGKNAVRELSEFEKTNLAGKEKLVTDSENKIADIRMAIEEKTLSEELRKKEEAENKKSAITKNKGDDEAKRRAEADRKAEYELLKLDLQQRIDYFKAIADNEGLSYNERLIAARIYYTAQQDLVKTEFAFEYATAGKTAKELELLTAQSNGKLLELQKDYGEKRLAILKSLSDRMVEQEKTATDTMLTGIERRFEQFEEKDRQRREKQKKQGEDDQADIDKSQEESNAIREAGLNSAIELTNFLGNLSKKNLTEEAQQAKDLLNQKKISQEEYDARIRQLRRKQAQDEKAQAIFNTLLQQGPVVLEGFKKGNVFGAAAALTLFFSMLSAVTSTEVPQFRYGGMVDGPGTGTSDSIPIRVSKGEYITRYEQAQKHKPALDAINEGRYDAHLMNYELPRLYQNMQMTGTPQFGTNEAGSDAFDYEKMADAFAKKLEENPQAVLSVDEDGFMMTIRKGNTVTNYKNKKLTT